MRVVLLAPARLSCRPDLSRLASETDARRAIQRIARLHPHGAAPVAPAAARYDRVIEDHEVADDALVPAVVWSGSLQGDRAPSPAGVMIRSATAKVTAHGVMTVALDVDLADVTCLRVAEDALCPCVSDEIAAIAGELGRAVRREGIARVAQPSPHDLRQDAFLWWHRLFVDPISAAAVARCQLDRYRWRSLRPGVRLRVGDGFSQLECDDAGELACVVDGLATASQMWLIADFLQRRLTEQAGRLRLAASLEARAEQQRQAAALYEEATVETSVLLQTLRYIVGAQRQTFETAAVSWNIPKQLGPLVQSAEALRQAVERRHQQARDARAARLGRAVSALAFVSGLAVVLNLFETAVGQKLPPQMQPARLLLAGVVALAAVSALVLVVRRDH